MDIEYTIIKSYILISFIYRDNITISYVKIEGNLDQENKYKLMQLYYDVLFCSIIII